MNKLTHERIAARVNRFDLPPQVLCCAWLWMAACLLTSNPAQATDCDNNGIQDNCDTFIGGIAQDFNAETGSSSYVLNGSAIRDSATGAIRLTNNINNLMGSVVFTDLVSMQRNWTATFKYKVGGGNGADGFSMAMLPNCYYSTIANFGEHGSGNYSLAVAFDTFQNMGEPNGNFLAVFSGTTYAKYTDGSNAVNSTIPTIDNNAWHTAQVIYRFGRVTVLIDGTPYITAAEMRFDTVQTANAFIAPTGYLAFGARTGGSNNQHWIDDVTLTVEQGPDCNCNAAPNSAEVIPYSNGYSLYFDPSVFGATRPSVKLLDNLFKNTGTTLTVEGWFRCGRNNQLTREYGIIIGMNNGDITSDDNPSGVTHYTPVIYVGEDGRLRAKWWNGQGDPITTPLPVDDDRWHHFALAGAVNTQSLYLDGALVGTLGGVIDHLDETQNFIGRGKWQGWPGSDQVGGAKSFNGNIDEVKLWNIALTQVQVQQSMFTEMVGSESGLVGYWRFEDGSGNTATDSAPASGASNGTLFYSPVWTVEIGGTDCNENGVEDICDTVCHGMSHLCTTTSAPNCSGLPGCLSMNVFTTCPSPSGIGQEVHFWAQFSPAAPTVLSGEVWWYVNNERVATTPVYVTNQSNLNYFSEYATTLAEYTPGTLSIRGVYVGCETDVNTNPIVFIGSTSHTLQVDPAPDTPCEAAQWVGTTTVSPSNTAVFGEPVIIRTTWHAPNHDLDALLGPVNYFRSPNQLDVFRQALKYNVGEDYSATLVSSTLPLGTYDLDVDYIGPEGEIVQDPFTLNVVPPPNPVKLTMSPPNLIMREGNPQTLRVCVSRLPGLSGSPPSGDIRLECEQAEYDQTLPLEGSGCAEFDVGSLSAGSYVFDATYAGDAAHMRSMTDTRMTVVPTPAVGPTPYGNEIDVIALVNQHELLPAHVNAVAPGVTFQVAVGARNVVAPPEAVEPLLNCLSGPRQGDPAFSPLCIPNDLDRDWDIDMSDVADLQRRTATPTSEPSTIANVYLNGGWVASAMVDALDSVCSFGSYNVSPGTYVLDVRFEGDDNHAPSSSAPLLIEVSSNPPSIAATDQATGIHPPQGSPQTDLALQAQPTFPVASKPVSLTGFVHSPKREAMTLGIPDGVLVFKDGTGMKAPILGKARLNGNAGSIRLPAGLSSGPHIVRLEYYDAGETTLLSNIEYSVTVFTGSSLVLATAETNPIEATRPNKLIADVYDAATLSGAGVGGAIDFYKGDQLIGSAPIANGRAELPWTAPNDEGTYSISALFAGGNLAPGAASFPLAVIPPSNIYPQNMYIMARLAALSEQFGDDNGDIPVMRRPSFTGITQNCADQTYVAGCQDTVTCMPPNSELFECSRDLASVLAQEFGLELVLAKYRLTRSPQNVTIVGQLSRVLKRIAGESGPDGDHPFETTLQFKSSFFVAKDDDALVISIRGTDGPENVHVNNQFEPALWYLRQGPEYVVAHPGWGYMTDHLYYGGFGGFVGLKSVIEQNRIGPKGPRRLYLTGHDMGGSLARMVMLRLAIDGLRDAQDRVYTFGAFSTDAYSYWIGLGKFDAELLAPLDPGYQIGYLGCQDVTCLYQHFGLNGYTYTVMGDRDRTPNNMDVRTKKKWDGAIKLNNVLEAIEDMADDITDYLEEHAPFLSDWGASIVSFFGGDSSDSAPLDLEIPRPIGYHSTFFNTVFRINADPNVPDETFSWWTYESRFKYHHSAEYVRFCLEQLRNLNQGYYFPNNNVQVRQPLNLQQ
ncbi:MAG: hypothetical protein HS101_07890 [Planctomycetia bacterium]|nr:hypothetical protein [Planctomycetia bacterium]